MTVFGIIALLLFAIVAFVWHSRRQNAKMALFIEKAIQKYCEDESPAALQYIVIAYSTTVGPTRNQVVWDPLLMAIGKVAEIQDATAKEATRARLHKIEQTLLSKEWTLGDSLRLKRELSHDCFVAWRKFDVTVFDRI
jgi:hypothetical protein